MLPWRGLCLYLTGRSGSGKTTIANKLQYNLDKIDNRIISILDGDEIRENISNGLGFSKKDRSINVRRIGYVSSIITKHKGIAICSNIAPYSEDRLYNKNIIKSTNSNYVEIFVDSSLNEILKRDPKGLYKINNNNIINSFYEYEIPTHSEIIINTNVLTIEDSVKKIIKYLNDNNLINYIR